MTEETLEDGVESSTEKEEKQSKIQEFLDKHFFKIFNPSHLLYTLLFFISAIIISLLSLVPNTGDIILFLAVSFSLSFIILTVMGMIPQLHDFLFSTEKNLDKNKIFGFLIAYGISFVIVLLYFIFGPSSNLSIQFFGWDILLPSLLVLIYFGWNVIQIFFLKTGFDDIAVKANHKLVSKEEDSTFSEIISWTFLVLAIATPVLIQIGGLFGFLPFFTPPQGEPQDPFYWFIGWNVGMFITMAITTWRLVTLFLKSKKNDTPNVYSSIFYILIWLIIWYRSFSFINSFRGEVQATGIDVISQITDILLMVATAILVLRGLGGKLEGSTIFNANNIPFFLYAFTLLYIEGQVILITGAGLLEGVFVNQDQVSMVSNFLTFIISVAFYLWYSEYSLQRKGLIRRSSFIPSEVVEVLREYRNYLQEQQIIKAGKMDDEEFQAFLEKKNLSTRDLEAKKEIDEKKEAELKTMRQEGIKEEKEDFEGVKSTDRNVDPTESNSKEEGSSMDS
ncbi:MAG: conserved membrane protein of unknown function [Promethearchaeota archaeon]|nr:MAG: conserved membrane protein of unknown function [Candidatus Lokiarchaeota archaeon]